MYNDANYKEIQPLQDIDIDDNISDWSFEGDDIFFTDPSSATDLGNALRRACLKLQAQQIEMRNLELQNENLQSEYKKKLDAIEKERRDQDLAFQNTLQGVAV